MNKFKYLAYCLLITLSAPAFAAEPKGWGLGFQPSASPLADRIHDFHNLLLWIIIAIALFVLALLIWVIVRYNKHANPTPKQFSHNVLIEVLWTAVPILILIVIAIPSFQILYKNDRTENPDMTLKIIGRQWYWDYEYPDHGDIAFSSYMIAEADIQPDQRRLLSTDTKVVLPVDTNIQLLVSAGDVLHSWTVPAFGVKMDAIPGRWNEAWVNISKPGTYFGQCSELCGKDHAYMPIEIKAVSKEEFKAWALENGASEEDFAKKNEEQNIEDEAQDG